MADKKKTDLMEASEGLIATLEGVSSDEIKQMAEYKAYLEALRQINKVSNELFTEEGDKGYPFVDKEKLQELLNYYSSCAKAIKGLKTALEAKNDKKDSTVAVLDLTDNVLSLVSKDFVTLKAYDPDKEQKTLPALINDARTVTFDVTGVKLKGVGGSLSTRFPLSYTKPDGTVIKGMFTCKEYVNPIPAFRKSMKAIIDKKDSYKAFFDDYCNAIKAANTKNGKLDPKVTDEWIMTDLFKKSHVIDRDGKPLCIFSNITTYMLKKVIEYKNLSDYDAVNAANNVADVILTHLANDQAFKHTVDKVEFNRQKPGIGMGSRIDSRNSAMSTVADLLGKSEIIARAVPARVKIGDRIVEGTFMEYASGMDPNNMTEEDKNLTSGVFERTNGLRSIADLQILDYICGNADRHIGNMMYNIDKKTGKCISVIGIDNDASMGIYNPTDNTLGNNKLASLNSLFAISESMAKAVMALEPEVLELALREYELSPEEIASCATRLGNIKNMINTAIKENTQDTGILRIIKDDDFKFCGLKYLTKTYKIKPTDKVAQVNIFGRLVSVFDRKQTDQLAPYKEPQLAEVYDRSLKVSAKAVQNYVKTAEAMVKTLSDRTADNRTSDNYVALQKACKAYEEYMKKVAENKKTLDMDGVTEMNDHLTKIIAAADTYLVGKGKLTGRWSYTQKRIDAALEIKKIAEKTIIRNLSKKDLDVMLDKKEQDETKVKEENRKKSNEQEGKGLKK